MGRLIEIWRDNRSARYASSDIPASDICHITLEYTARFIDAIHPIPTSPAIRCFLAMAIVQITAQGNTPVESVPKARELALVALANHALGPLLAQRVRQFFQEPVKSRLINAVVESRTPISETQAAPSDQTEPQVTRYGGAFLLLPFLNEDYWCCFNPEMEIAGTSYRSVWRYVALRYCLGTHGAGLTGDPLWRDLLGLSPEFSKSDLEQWLDQPFDEVLWRDTVGHAVAQSLYSSKPAHRPLPAMVTHEGMNITVDTATGRWLSMEIDDASEPNAIDNETIVNPVQRDLDYLAGAFDNAFATPLKRAMAVTAQHAVRSFAVRLRGFERASMPHIHANLIGGSAVLYPMDDRLHVVLDKPPLHMVLGMTTIVDRPHQIPWLDHRPLFLSFNKAT